MLQEKRALLGAWNRSLRILHRGGFMAAKYYGRLNVWLGVPVVVITSVAGSTIFATSGVVAAAETNSMEKVPEAKLSERFAGAGGWLEATPISCLLHSIPASAR